MNIVIFSGGTGSRALQQGFADIFKGKIKPTVLINAYDNGLSTGAVRKVLDGLVLGPSDLRKNQELAASFYSSKESILSFLNKRVSAPSATEMEQMVLSEIDGIPAEEYNAIKVFRDATSYFFSKENANLIQYDDFSIANIIYAGIAGLHNNSLQHAGQVMGQLLDINPNGVILVSDNSLFLQAVTKSGTVILDEGDLVKWNNPTDPIVHIKLVDVNNEEMTPKMTSSSLQRIAEADLIIFSSGTLWSSLIPTYIHDGFVEAVAQSKAKKYMVMNNQPDQDMTGVDAQGVLDIVKDFLPADTKIIFNTNSHPSLKKPYDSEVFIEEEISNENAKTHSPSVAAVILKDFFEIGKKKVLFDFDNTIVDKQDLLVEVNRSNLGYLRSNNDYAIVSGNSLNHINKKIAGKGAFRNEFYCDGGNSLCKWNDEIGRLEFIEYVDTSKVYTNEETKFIYDSLTQIGIPIWKIENRNNCIISVKPVEDSQRYQILEKINFVLGDKYVAKPLGKTTIDIFKTGYEKDVVLQRIKGDIFYVGDEVNNPKGNDYIFNFHPNVKAHHVLGPEETLAILIILQHGRSKN